MSNYSEKQLLMLTQFVYLDCSVSDASIEDILNKYKDAQGEFTVESVKGAGAGGGMNDEGVVSLFTQMDDEMASNPDFGKLSASRKLNEDKVIRAICYTDEADENPVLAIRGTGGTKEAWTDNVMGGYETDTKLQKLTSDFVKNECAMYSDITVTGHSKGGNLSQYVTVMCPEMIGRCVSFDGQGFCKDFIEENSELIEVASPKIKSISAYNDFVNILLTSIAGSAIFVANDAGLLNAHSGLSMLLNNEYDENGDIKTIEKQSEIAKGLKNLTDKLVTFIDPLDTRDKEMISSISGTTIATALDERTQHKLITTSGVLYANVICGFVDNYLEDRKYEAYEVTPEVKLVYFDKTGVDKSLLIMEENHSEIRLLKERIKAIEEEMSETITSWIYADRRLKRVISDMEDVSLNIDKLSQTMETVRLRYDEKEKTLISLFGS